MANVYIGTVVDHRSILLDPFVAIQYRYTARNYAMIISPRTTFKTFLHFDTVTTIQSSKESKVEILLVYSSVKMTFLEKKIYLVVVHRPI